MTAEEQAALEAEREAAEAAAAREAAEEAERDKPTEDVATLKAQLAKEREERKKANAEAAKHRAEKKAAQEAALAEQGKHKELAEQRQKELEALQPELEQLRAEKAQREQREAEERARRDAQVAAEFAQLPEAVRNAVPADADPRIREATITAYRVAKGDTRPPTNTAASPKPINGPPSSEVPELTPKEMWELGYTGTSKARLAELVEKKNAWLRSRAG